MKTFLARLYNAEKDEFKSHVDYRLVKAETPVEAEEKVKNTFGSHGYSDLPDSIEILQTIE